VDRSRKIRTCLMHMSLFLDHVLYFLIAVELNFILLLLPEKIKLPPSSFR
jgi:hypothetical protein